jgi:hypothetical protein
MAHRGPLLLLAFIAAACPSQSAERRVSDAAVFTKRYAQSPFVAWNVRGHAAGLDCGVLLVETSVVMDDSMVEALHYGAGSYAVVAGGVQRFYRDRDFRAVAYRDLAGHVWHYGDLTPQETKSLKPCA